MSNGLDEQFMQNLMQTNPESVTVSGKTDDGSGFVGQNVQTVNSVMNKSRQTNLFGTLEIEGDNIYYVFLVQMRSQNIWYLTERTVFDGVSVADRESKIVAVLKSHTNGVLEGYGKTFILVRLMTNISAMVSIALSNVSPTATYTVGVEYNQQSTGDFIKFKTTPNGSTYIQLELAYEGFKLSLDSYNRALPFKCPKLFPVVDDKSKAAVVANLGIKTFAGLMRSRGESLKWYKDKNYKLIDTNEKFRAMMLDYLRAVQLAHDKHMTVLTGLDTETTGLHMLNLAANNEYKDHVVAIPFAWKDNEAYVICVDMYYFSNVDRDEIFPLFTQLFSRNRDFTFQHIELDYCGEHFSFGRENMTIAGWNVMFDEMAFFTEGCDVFFDEDGRQIYFDLDTDLVQGAEGRKESGTYKISNSLKAQTRRMIGDETLELDELFGPHHEDKYRYLQDTELALVYGGADADYTRLVIRKGRAMMPKILYQQYRKYDMTVMYQMAVAGWNGMPIDVDAVREQGDKVCQDLERLKDFIYHYAWLANRETLEQKNTTLQELLGFQSSIEVDEVMEKDKMFRYSFTPANHKRLLFGLLGYPVIKRAEKTGEPALDKYVLSKLMAVQRETPVEVLLEDVMSVADPTVKLIDKDKFNRDAYPLARIFSTYATLNKEYTSYYRPILDNDMEGRMFYDFTLARAATRRILSPGQTMKGSLKSLVIAPKGQLFMSFDASQIEYRHMASLAYIRTKKLLKRDHPDDWEERLNKTAVARIFAMMQKEEADYHIETAAMMTGVRQHEVTPKVRKQYKKIGFGIPYGLGDRAMCESLFGSITDTNMQQTQELLAKYKDNQREIIELLESTRDSAFVPNTTIVNDDMRKYLGVGDTNVGIVSNFVGFYRVFILEQPITRARAGRIRRQAGNCIIQGGAAELFRRMLFNFHTGCCKEGIDDKIHWLMTVHDELDATVDADIDIMKLIKVLYQNCTLRYADHIPYYIGINFGFNWYDAKADSNELPVIMVQRMIEAYDKGKFSIPSDGNQPQYLLQLKRHYMCDRVEEELSNIVPHIRVGHVWTDEEVALVDDKFENYVVRAYLDAFSSSKELKAKLEGWQKAREEYGFGNSFLTESLGVKSADIDDIDLDMDFDLDLELLENSSEEELQEEKEGTTFGEGELFDQTIPLSEMLVENSSTVFVNQDMSGKGEELVENETPTSAFDVYLTNHYIRTRVLKVSDGVYSVLTNGTRYRGKEQELRSEIKSHFSTGKETVMIIGLSMLKISQIACTDEDLDWLDKFIAET